MQLPETAVKRHLLESMPIFFNILNARPMQLGDDFDYSSLEHKNGIYVVYQWFENKWVERYIGSVFSNNGTTNSLKSRVYTHITTLGHTKCGFDNYALSFKELNEFPEVWVRFFEAACIAFVQPTWQNKGFGTNCAIEKKLQTPFFKEIVPQMKEYYNSVTK